VLVALWSPARSSAYLESVVPRRWLPRRSRLCSSLPQDWALRDQWEKILTVALTRYGRGPVQGTGTGAAFQATGSRTQVSTDRADAFLVPAGTDSGTKVSDRQG